MDDKATLYHHTTTFLDPPSPTIWDLGPKPVYKEDGTVWLDGDRVGFWYALVGPSRGTIVRRDKLADLERIERARWKVLTRTKGVVWERFKKALDKANELGRIWIDGEFRYATEDSTPSRRRNEEEPKDAIERLSMIPSEEEELAGKEYVAAEKWRSSYWEKIRKIDVILQCAMGLHREAPKIDQYGGMRTQAVNVTYKLNGRLYINYTPNGWGQATQTIWPDPSDDTYVVPTTKERFGHCRFCGLRHQGRPRSACDYCKAERDPLKPPRRRSTMRPPGRGRALEDRYRRRLGKKK